MGATILAILHLVIMGSFVVAVLSDNDLRRTGTPINATVIENDDDDGFPTVAFELDGEEFTAEIDATGARPAITQDGQRVPIVVDEDDPGYAVPALVDSSTIWIENLVIAAAICVFLDLVILGAAGLVFAVRARRRGRRIETDAFTAPAGTTTMTTESIPLRSWRFARPSSLEIGPNRLLARLSTWFGDVPLIVPLMDLSIADPSVAVQATDHTRLPLCEPLVPLLRTHSNFDEPDLMLLFAHPVRVPPVRLLQWGTPELSASESRREPGVFIDGMVLAVGDPGAAVAALRQRGVPVVDPTHWAIETFGEMTDPEMVATRRRKTRTAGMLLRVGGVALFGAVVLALWSSFVDEIDLALIAISLALVAAAGVAHVAGRRIRR